MVQNVRKQCEDIVNDIIHMPALIVHSGHFINAWWLPERQCRVKVNLRYRNRNNWINKNDNIILPGNKKRLCNSVVKVMDGKHNIVSTNKEDRS